MVDVIRNRIKKVAIDSVEDLRRGHSPMPPACVDGNSMISAPPGSPSGMIIDRDSSLDGLISWLTQSGAEINGVVVRNVEGKRFSHFTLIQAPDGVSLQLATSTRERR